MKNEELLCSVADGPLLGDSRPKSFQRKAGLTQFMLRFT